MRGAFRGQTTQAKRIGRLTKGKEVARSVKDTLGHLPTKIPNRMVQRKEIKLAPSRWPVKATIHREKLQNTVGRQAVFRQQETINRLCRNFASQGDMEGRRRRRQEVATTGRPTATDRLPSGQ